MKKTVAAAAVIVLLAAAFFAYKTYTGKPGRQPETPQTAEILSPGTEPGEDVIGALKKQAESRMQEAPKKKPAAPPKPTASSLVLEKPFFTKGPEQNAEKQYRVFFPPSTELKLKLSGGQKDRLRKAAGDYRNKLAAIYSEYRNAMEESDHSRLAACMRKKKTADAGFDEACARILTKTQRKRLEDILYEIRPHSVDTSDDIDKKFSNDLKKLREDPRRYELVVSGDPFHPYMVVTKEEHERMKKEYMQKLKERAAQKEAEEQRRKEEERRLKETAEKAKAPEQPSGPEKPSAPEQPSGPEQDPRNETEE
ncbi:MAG: hypothetical protein ILO36_03630 [Abditibacteriota bacterium]|nr:hypothetical protein [Abditibacteriota bacterium]